MIVDKWKRLQSYIATKVRLGGVLPNDGYITGVPKCIFRGGNLVGNVGTGLDTLLTVPFPAKSLKSNDDLIHAKLGGGFGTNDDNKRVQLEFGPFVITNTGLIDIDGSSFGFDLDVTIIRRSSTLVNIRLGFIIGIWSVDSTPTPGGSVGWLNASINHNLVTVNDMDTNSNDLVLKGESATATDNNVFWNVGEVYLTRF